MRVGSELGFVLWVPPHKNRDSMTIFGFVSLVLGVWVVDDGGRLDGITMGKWMMVADWMGLWWVGRS